MKRLKNAIGYNTVSSVDGIISARGVKSKPKNLEIFGYTHEIGTGEKSPDNPYKLRSLDIGNVNLYSKDKITDIQVTNTGAVRKGFEIDASKFKSSYCTIYFDEENTSPNLSDGTSVGINIKFLYKNGTYETFTRKNHIEHSRIDKITEDVEKVIIYNAGHNLNAEYFSLYADLMIIDSSIMPSEYITDEHSIILSNNYTAIQVPVPLALSRVGSSTDYIFKDNDDSWKLAQNTATIDSYAGEDISTAYISSTGSLSAGATIVYQLDSPVIHTLSRYAQDLLNSFELETQNKIYVEGNPDIKVSGYIQKMR